MGLILDYLVEHYIAVIIVGLICVFALVGYISDDKRKKNPNTPKEENAGPQINMANIDSSVRLGETVNKMTGTQGASVNVEPSVDAEIPAIKVQGPPQI